MRWMLRSHEKPTGALPDFLTNRQYQAMQSSFLVAKRDVDAKKITYELLVILIGPALVFIFPRLPFANNGNCDPWYVHGLYFNLPEFLRWYPNLRQTGRLTATLPGYFLTYTLPGISSDYVLFFLFFTLAALFLYKTAALLLSRERAAFAAIFFALSPIVIGNYAVTYTAFSVTYEILAFYCATRAIFAGGWRRLFGWMFLSGIAWGAALQAHLGVLAFSGFIYLFFGLCVLFEFERDIRSRIGSIATGAGAVLLGLAIITAGLSIFSAVMWHAQYSTVLNQVYYVSLALERDARLYWNKDWYLESSSIGMYLLGFAAAAIAASQKMPLRRDDASAAERRNFALAASFITTLAILLFHALSRGVYLQYEYYYVFLWPFLALALFAVGIERGVRTSFALVLLFALACFAGVAIKQYEMPDWAIHQQTIASLVLGVIAIVLLFVLQRAVRTSLLGGYLLTLALLTLFVRPHETGWQLWEAPNSKESRHSYARLNSGLKFLAATFKDPNVAPFDKPKFWLDEDSVLDAPSYARSYLWCQFPRLPNIGSERWTGPDLPFEPGDALVIVARPPDLFNRVKSALSKLNLEPGKIGSATIVDEKGPYELLVVSVRSTSPQ
jgi:hypothetical protein